MRTKESIEAEVMEYIGEQFKERYYSGSFTTRYRKIMKDRFAEKVYRYAYLIADNCVDNVRTREELIDYLSEHTEVVNYLNFMEQIDERYIPNIFWNTISLMSFRYEDLGYLDEDDYKIDKDTIRFFRLSTI